MGTFEIFLILGLILFFQKQKSNKADQTFQKTLKIRQNNFENQYVNVFEVPHFKYDNFFPKNKMADPILRTLQIRQNN